MLSKQELRYMLALQRVPNLGDTSAKKLLRTIGSAEGVFKESKNKLLKIEGIGLRKLQGFSEKQQLDIADQELEFMKENNISYSYFQDKAYPENLKHCIDGPILFFHRGNMDFQNRKIISIVGTRKVTSYGRSFCKRLIEELSPLNPIIVSGFAYGVDIIAHKASMANRIQTIACLAHGLNQIYPKIHQKYERQMENNGGFISEFWSSDAFDRNNFLKRNRIIAGISQATIVIESGEKGGSLVTADISNSYNREVFAVPGRAFDIQSQGCNNLIKTQQAHVLTQAADVVYILGWEMEELPENSQQKQLFVELSDDEKQLVNFLKEHDKQLLDIIALHCKFQTHKTASLLLNMELKGLVRPLPGKFFELI